MLKKLFEKLKDEDKNYKKTMENLAISAIILIVAILFINSFFNGKPKVIKNLPNNQSQSEQSESYNNSDLENKLSEILSKINGAGNVSVMISYKSTIETVPLYDVKDDETVTEEKDTNGGARKTTQKGYENKIIYNEENGKKTPVICKKLMPKIEGVIVVATGGDNIMVKDNILKAVEAVTDVPTHKIQVFSKSKVN